ncbi:MAG: sigma-70 family RNA polymerase sigma factor [Lachnospiraceae bacterium]|nr:sigma-70 family RNA polymerase sigma factor [Lachnospiraceae bacterium]
MKIGEHNFIQQLQLQNEKALLYVIDKYGGLLMSIIRKQLFGIPHRQEECFNDVLLKIWQNISDFDERKNTFKNWAAAVTRYRAIDYLRQYQREVATVDIDDTVIVKEDRILARMIERELSEEVEMMLDSLKPVDRELFMKLYVEEQSMEQVSRETGMKQEVIYNHLSRSKRKLRRQFGIERGV